MVTFHAFDSPVPESDRSVLRRSFDTFLPAEKRQRLSRRNLWSPSRGGRADAVNTGSDSYECENTRHDGVMRYGLLLLTISFGRAVHNSLPLQEWRERFPEPTFRSLKTPFWICSTALFTSFTGLLRYLKARIKEHMAYFGAPMVIEALSPGTELTDRTRKLKSYRAHPTIEEYILADSRSPKKCTGERTAYGCTMCLRRTSSFPFTAWVSASLWLISMLTRTLKTLRERCERQTTQRRL